MASKCVVNVSGLRNVITLLFDGVFVVRESLDRLGPEFVGIVDSLAFLTASSSSAFFRGGGRGMELSSAASLSAISSASFTFFSASACNSASLVRMARTSSSLITSRLSNVLGSVRSKYGLKKISGTVASTLAIASLSASFDCMFRESCLSESESSTSTPFSSDFSWPTLERSSASFLRRFLIAWNPPPLSSNLIPSLPQLFMNPSTLPRSKLAKSLGNSSS
mmetsp:Transcript_687/g.1591  ORF Transcript_687/g.1591 Transcript_687/m.1591 type:complete len:222 (-) Transcript_687:1277-1942(-)